MDLLTANISRDALLANLAAIRRRAGDQAGLCALVKAEAYGHGLDLVAPVLADAGVQFLAVARVEEALRIRELGVTTPILLVEPLIDPRGDRELADRLDAICRVPDLHATLADASVVGAVAAAAAGVGGRLSVHVKIDTGMGRSGALTRDADAMVRSIEQASSLALVGAYTHLATADEADETFAQEQLSRFAELMASWSLAGRRLPWVHAANSAGIVRFSQAGLTLARPGLAIYGYQCGEDGDPTREPMPLTPTLALVGRLIGVKDLPAGHTVGYGCTWRAPRTSRIGLLPVGYGDGYSRVFGNRAVMQVDGRDVPVVGRISMDLTTVDLTDLPDGGRSVQPGHRVTIISNDRTRPNSVEGLARIAGTIPYEITCRISARVRRVPV